LNFIGVYNSLAYGNYTILAGNEKFKTTVEKMAVQHPNLVVINEKLTPEDLQTVNFSNPMLKYIR